MAYTKKTWVSGETPLSAENMNHIEQGVADAHNDISSLNTNLKTQYNYVDAGVQQGYLLQNCGSKLMQQFGIVTDTTDSNGMLKITFPQAYNIVPTVIVTPVFVNDSRTNVCISDVSTTGFKVYISDYSAGLHGNMRERIEWFAIGRVN